MPKYDDIINLERPISKHEKMPIEKRASIFSPFAALTGFSEKIIETERFKETKKVLGEDEKDNLDLLIKELKKDLKRMVTITYFNIDKYETITGFIKKIDEINKWLIYDNNIKIFFDDIINIKFTR